MAGKIIDEDFQDGTLVFDDLRLGNGTMGMAYESLKGNIANVEVVTEENKTKFLNAALWGSVGLAAFGLVGCAAGVLAAGNRKEICFACHLKDGRKFMAIVDTSLYQKIVADSMSGSAPVATAKMLQRRKQIERKVNAERRAKQAVKYQTDAAKRREEWEAKTPAQRHRWLSIQIGTGVFLLVLAWFTYFVFTGVDPLFGL